MDELTKDRLNFIKLIFNLTDDDLYKHIDLNNYLKVFNLYLLAINWRDAGFNNYPIDLVTSNFNNQSIKDMLFESELDSEKILFTTTRLSSEYIKQNNLY